MNELSKKLHLYFAFISYAVAFLSFQEVRCLRSIRLDKEMITFIK